MDPFTLVVIIGSIVTSTASFTSSVSKVADGLTRSDPSLKNTIQELNVLMLVLGECENIFTSGTEVSKAAEGALSICLERYNHLMEMLQRYRIESKGSFATSMRKLRVYLKESERKLAFDAFRDSVILLRDLASEVRMNKQLVKMSVGMAELMADFSEPDSDQAAIGSSSSQSQGGQLPPQIPVRSYTGSSLPPGKRKDAMQAFAKLIEANFTRDATIIIDKQSGEGPSRFRYIPVRAKMDTGCDDNLISHELLTDNGVVETMLVPNDENKEFMSVQGFRFSPEYQIELTWYQDREMKARQSVFHVVKDAPFDILLGSKRMAMELQSPALILANRHKKKAEIAAQKANYDKQKREAADLELKLLQQGKNERDALAAQQAAAVAGAQAHGTTPTGPNAQGVAQQAAAAIVGQTGRTNPAGTIPAGTSGQGSAQQAATVAGPQTGGTNLTGTGTQGTSQTAATVAGPQPPAPNSTGTNTQVTAQQVAVGSRTTFRGSNTQGNGGATNNAGSATP
ncbi:uncharacterized protein BP5553_05391 [Venustampulla echinocandica]|uniref:Fungal N-terminal domain-containing protein n=1 Tax=Venustampulla echinocandica TaxID=2656787 RepID=A0A370TR20_9HELO|nr:uncharacterized protein BP5553_05391 [Venustampulla echinocandica]RDL37958.1 hypothetical protein BP5553_05391 [Venustampulla echinocandica]